MIECIRNRIVDSRVAFNFLSSIAVLFIGVGVIKTAIVELFCASFSVELIRLFVESVAMCELEGCSVAFNDGFSMKSDEGCSVLLGEFNDPSSLPVDDSSNLPVEFIDSSIGFSLLTVAAVAGTLVESVDSTDSFSNSLKYVDKLGKS